MIWYIMIDKSNIWYQPSTQKNKYHQIRPTLHPHHNRGSPKITLNAGIPPDGTKYHQHHQCSNTQHTRNIFNFTTSIQCWHHHQHNDISPKITKTCAYLYQMVTNNTMKNSGLPPYGAERHKSSGASPVDACCSPMQVIVSHQLALSLLPAGISPFSPSLL